MVPVSDTKHDLTSARDGLLNEPAAADEPELGELEPHAAASRAMALSTATPPNLPLTVASSSRAASGRPGAPRAGPPCAPQNRAWVPAFWTEARPGMSAG